MAPKRPADSYGGIVGSSTNATQASIQPSTSKSGKRVKFDPTTLPSKIDDSEPLPGDLEDDLETGGSGRKNIVTDGYDSDSSAGSDGDENGGFGGAGGGRKGAAAAKGKEAGGEDDDMFGGDADDEVKDAKEKKKEKEFLEMGDIEGQEFGKGDEEDGDADELDEEDEEEYAPEDDLANDDDAPRSRRSKKGMGYQLSSFNMQEELNEGRFAADGTYVRNNEDPLATHDKWLDGVSKSAIKAARESKKRMEEEAKRREEREAKGDDALVQQRDDCMIGLLKLIREGETVTMALNRLGKKRRKVARKQIKPKVQDGDEAMELDDAPSGVDKGKGREDGNGDEEEDPAVKKIDQITLLASTLLAQGELEIYDTSYESIIKTLKEEGAVRRDWVPPVDPDIAKEEADAAQAGGARRGIIARPTAATATARPSPAQTTPVPATSSTNGKRFFYKWKVAQAGQPPDQEYGPFGSTEIEQWIAGGFLGPSGANIVVRVEGQGGKAWTSWTEAKL